MVFRKNTPWYFRRNTPWFKGGTLRGLGGTLRGLREEHSVFSRNTPWFFKEEHSVVF